ncbi:MAG: alpha/beta hydrolase [Acidobacteriaceae bacterium]
MKQQVIVIHGGDTFDNYQDYLKFISEWEIDFESYRKNKQGWKQNLSKDLGKNFEVIAPKMPNKFNAKYKEWKIWFDKFVPYFKKDVLLIGHSLGGIFLAKYLSENKLPKQAKALFLVAAPFDEDNKKAEDSLADFRLPKSFKKLSEQVDKIFIYHSKDDPIVPFIDSGKYSKLLPKASLRVSKDRGHFIQEKFSELVKDIKSL